MSVDAETVVYLTLNLILCHASKLTVNRQRFPILPLNLDRGSEHQGIDSVITDIGKFGDKGFCEDVM